MSSLCLFAVPHERQFESLSLILPGSLIRRTGRVSIVVIALSVVMVIGGLAVAGFGVVIVMDAVREGKLGPSALCH